MRERSTAAEIVARRRLDQDFVIEFARLSGDFNPLHVDPVAARRLAFGAQIVHGMLLVIWALEAVARTYKMPSFRLTKLKAEFVKPILVGQEASIRVNSTGTRFEIDVLRQDGVLATHLQFHLEYAANAVSGTLAPLPYATESKAHSDDEYDGLTGSIGLGLDTARLQQLYPGLAGLLPDVQVAELLAQTRIVGMECPGLHSIFSSLDVQFGAARQLGRIAYSVSRWDRRFSRMEIGIEGETCSGKLVSLVRAEPVKQPSLSELAPLVPKNLFKNQRALVVGGSRGIGEVCAKLLAAGGAAEITLTYRLGKHEAEQVCTEINEFCPSKAIFFDIMNVSSDAIGKYTNVYYFASPMIVRKSGNYSDELENFYKSYYIGGVERASSFARNTSQHVEIFQPSTTFIESRPAGFDEYVNAKIAAEKHAEDYSRQSPNVTYRMPRFPPLRTDQTTGNRRAEKVVGLLLGHLKDLSSTAHNTDSIHAPRD